jgi:hypothetical protein
MEQVRLDRVPVPAEDGVRAEEEVGWEDPVWVPEAAAYALPAEPQQSTR